ncbi:DNA-binding NarL/FixJ family response regulator [Streptomyces tendae]
MTAVGETANGAEAVELARRERPDVVLTDIRVPDLDGIEAARQICTDPALSAVRVLILTTIDLDEYVYAAPRAPSVTRRLITEFARRPEPARTPIRSLDGITDRELEVLGLIARGLSNTEITEHLHLSLATVKTTSDACSPSCVPATAPSS